jgi:hypothetical protein
MNAPTAPAAVADAPPSASTWVRPAWLRHPAAQWQRGTLDRDALAAAVERRRASATFAGAPAQFAATMVDTFESSWALNRLMREAPRLALIGFILYLHHRRGHDEAGVTFSRIRELFAMGSDAGVLATPTRIKAMLGLAQMAGHLRRVPQTGADRRRKVLEPTDRLFEPALRWKRHYFGVVGRFAPLLAPPERVPPDPLFLCQYMTFAVSGYIHDGFTLYERSAPMRHFLSRENGYLVAMEITRTMTRDPHSGAWRAAAPSVTLARRFAVARGTVRNILAHAQREGWLEVRERGGHEVVLDPAFAEELQRWVALEIEWSSTLANEAATALGRVPAAGDA